MTATARFPTEVLALLRKSNGLRVRAGDNSHRFIGIWFVLVDDRVFVRSWSVKPDGWYRAFRSDPHGQAQIGRFEIAVKAVAIRGKRLRDDIDRAYLAKYHTPGALRYAQDLSSPKSRATTLELCAVKKQREVPQAFEA